MKRKPLIILLAISIALTVLLTISVGKNNSGSIADTSLISRTGERTTLAAELKPGVPVLLDFFTTWCTYCIKGLPDVKDAYKEIEKDKLQLQIVGIDIGEPHNRVYTFVDGHGLDYKVLIDPKGALAKKFKVRGVPTYIVLNKEGTVVYQDNYFPDWKSFL